MPIPACFLVPAFMAACAVVPPQAWTYDPTRPQPKVAVPMTEVVALSNRVAQLQLQRNEIRAQIATEPDVWKRQEHYVRLHSVGTQLSAQERRLASITPAR